MKSEYYIPMDQINGEGLLDVPTKKGSKKSTTMTFDIALPDGVDQSAIGVNLRTLSKRSRFAGIKHVDVFVGPKVHAPTAVDLAAYKQDGSIIQLQHDAPSSSSLQHDERRASIYLDTAKIAPRLPQEQDSSKAWSDAINAALVREHASLSQEQLGNPKLFNLTMEATPGLGMGFVGYVTSGIGAGIAMGIGTTLLWGTPGANSAEYGIAKEKKDLYQWSFFRPLDRKTVVAGRKVVDQTFKRNPYVISLSSK